MSDPAPSPSNTSTVRLSVDALAAQRGGRLIFRGLTFSATGGQAIVIAGPNGSGKSTLLRLLTGLARPEAGTIERDPGEPEHLRIVSHLDGLKGALTVLENLAFWAGIYSAPEESVDGAMDRLALSPMTDMPVDMLSAGWRRRVGLARLIIGNAPLWILDEPYTALDTDNVARVDGLMEDHVSQGGLVVLATHQAPRFTPALTIDMAAYAAPAEVVEW